jgi:hypothetical protein
MSAPTTTRARYDKHLTDPACSNCHAQFQPMGDAFEGYDPIGVWRTQQNGFSIDTSGALVGVGGGPIKVASAVELMKVLTQRREVTACVAQQAFRFTLGRLPAERDACELQAIGQEFDQSTRDVRSLVGSLVGSDAFVKRTVHFQ